jgi:hypothetical protein
MGYHVSALLLIQIYLGSKICSSLCKFPSISCSVNQIICCYQILLLK